jgi:acyl-CoA synthetase (AMP-forming)/AMP-acid ligase II/3-hydroxymyristoyl/3-hydroxydecanoyl-(acyl carrier protein) dehydratase
VQLTALSSWLFQLPQQIVAVRKGEQKTTANFEQRVIDWVHVLADYSGTRWAVYHSDAYEFLAIVFALWQLDRVACIPGDNRAGTMQRLKIQVAGFVGQCDVTGTLIEAPSNHAGKTRWKTLAPNFIALEIYTSGSTGEPKSIAKTIAQLDLEIQTLEAQWPSRSQSVVLATVTHQHLYGLTFRLLWPISAGCPFEREYCEYTEDVLHLASGYPWFSLISSPSHLGRINASLDWHQLAGRCNYVLSSAAPLSCADSINTSKVLGAPVREIYGSSETGAIAWRQQQDPERDALWQPLPEVELEPAADDTLIVRAPYLPDPGFLGLADRVVFNRAGHFRLIGRIDRIVKVEGKRISLSAIENLLLEHPWIKNVRALTVERRRVETAVVIELNEAGCQQLERLSNKLMIKQLKATLTDYFEAVVIPRRWRFVAQMPFNQQGKLPLDRLQALFEKEPVKWPEILQQGLIDDQLSIECRVLPELIYFDGHFPDNPILPGIVQTHWAEVYGRQLLQVQGEFVCLEAVKFQQVIPPGCHITLTLKYDALKNKLSFRYESKRGVHSSGRICFQ